MKGYWGHLVKNRSGTIKLTPEDTDDIWNLYNIISVGDEIESMTIRKVIQENSSGNAIDSQKMKLVLAVKAEKFEVDLVAGCLRVNGKNVKENKFVKLGSYHTLELECDRYFKLTKSSWDPLSLEIIRQSTSDAGKYDVVAILLQESTAQICTLNGNNTNSNETESSSFLRIVQRIEENLPKKRIGSAFEKGIERFYENVIQSFLQSFELKSLKAIIIASPGQFREELYKRLMDLAVKDESKKFINENKSKFIRIPLQSFQVSALQESLKEPRIAALLEGTKTVIESKLLDSFHKLNKNSEGMTEFGWNPVLKAAKLGAVKNLLLSDSLFRSLDVKERKKYIDLVEEVKDNGGNVQIFVTGTGKEKELALLSGVAAILNFPIQ